MSPLLSGHKILYIDDDPANCVLIKRVLEADGYHVLLAASGSDGLAQAEGEQPDLILLDLHMPGLDGYEVAACLRQREGTRSTPILILSASRAAADKARLARLGCNGYIPKPVDVDAIAEQIAALL